jgi:hypothetical protein
MALAAFTWDLRVGAKMERLSPGHLGMIRSIEILHDEEGAGVVVISVDAWDEVNQRFRFLDEGILDEGTVIYPWIGYGAPTTCLGRFVVARPKTHYGAGMPTIKIEAYDALKKLVDCQKARVWQNIVDDTQIVYSIATEHGLIPSVSTPSSPGIVRPRPVIKEGGMSDLDFLKLFAELHDYEPPQVLWSPLAGDVLYLRARKDAELQTPEETLQYLPSSNGWAIGAAKAQVSDLNIDDDTGTMPTAVEVVGFDSEGKIVLVRATYSSLGVQIETDLEWASQHIEAAGLVDDGVLLKLQVEGEGKKKLPNPGFESVTTSEGSALIPVSDMSTRVVSGSFVESKQTAEEYAKSFFEKEKGKHRTVTGRYSNLKGIESIAVHGVFELAGTMKRHAGKYIMTSVQHTIDNQGHSVTFSMRSVVPSGSKAVSTFTVLEVL